LRQAEEDCRVRRELCTRILADVKRQRGRAADWAADDQGDKASVQSILTIVRPHGDSRLVTSSRRDAHPSTARWGGRARHVASAIRGWTVRSSVRPASLMAAASLLLCFGIVLTPSRRKLVGPELIVAAENTTPAARSATSVLGAAGPFAESDGAERDGSAEASPIQASASPVETAQSASLPVQGTFASELPAEVRRPPQLTFASFEPNTGKLTKGEPAVATTIVGTWASNERACRSRPTNLLPAVIDNDGARAGETFCAFKKKRLERDGMHVTATCSSPRERWNANVKLRVEGNRLTWSSRRGSQTYVRCGPNLQVASR
jgi:hypothetical protein